MASSFAFSGLTLPAQAQNGAEWSAAGNGEFSQTASGVEFKWRGAVFANEAGEPSVTGWEVKDLGIAQLPAKIVVVQLPDGAKISSKSGSISTRVWEGGILPSVKPSADIKVDDANEVVSAEPKYTTLPVKLSDSPIVVLDDGRVGGHRVAQIAITPIFLQKGKPVAASEIQILIPGAKIVNYEDLDPVLNALSSSRYGQKQPANSINSVNSVQTITTPAINPAALVSSVKITASQRGIQRITGSALAATGISMGSINNAHVYYRGTEIPTQVIDNGTPGTFDAGDELRFYAQPGDRWNSSEVYWLVFDGNAGLHMGTRNVAANGAAPNRTSALEMTTYMTYTTSSYDSHYPGFEGDYLTSKIMNALAVNASWTGVALPAVLPRADGTGSMTLTLQTVNVYQDGSTCASYNWSVTGNDTAQVVSYSASNSIGNKAVPIAFSNYNASINITLNAPKCYAFVDSIVYTRPVYLDFAGNIGAEFLGYPAAWNYNVSNVNTAVSGGAWLYDITDPLNPLALKQISASTFSFYDTAAYRYLITGNGTIYQPALALNTASTIDQPMNTQVLYIGPESFRTTINPLITHRQSQGYTAAYIDAQKLYDAWSYGRVSPYALRDFLRYAYTTWGVQPISVVIVGDSSADPRNLVPRIAGQTTNSIVPTLFSPAELGLDTYGELPCDMCIAQLDGATPFPASTYGTTSTHMPELAVGRFPVNDTTQLGVVVNKIIGYETQVIGNAAWQKRASFLSDNYYCLATNHVNCSAGTGANAGYWVDDAGDFYASTWAGMAYYPGWMMFGCDMYRPSPPDSPATTNPCFESSSSVAKTRAIDLYTQGALTMVYTGHSNERAMASLATTDDALLNVARTVGVSVTSDDVTSMNNGLKLPVTLQMTCLTSRFVSWFTRAGSNSTIDEELLLRQGGGAIATWGPTGADSVAAHDGLLAGFLKKLWGVNYQPTLGELTQASRLEMLTSYPAAKAVIFSFVLLGDPMTKVRKNVANVYVPSTMRVMAAGW